MNHFFFYTKTINSPFFLYKNFNIFISTPRFLLRFTQGFNLCTQKRHNFILFLLQIDILVSCYVDHPNRLVIQGDQNLDNLNKWSVETATMTLTITDANISSANKNWTVPLADADIVILSVDSYDHLKLQLSKLRSIPGWSIETHYFILNLSNTSCLNALDYLNAAWKINLLSSFFLCNSETEQQVFTYNPYSNRAPPPWQQTQYSKLQNNPRWTLYNRPYKSKSICKNLIFDKMQFLDGYPIKTIAHSTMITQSDIKKYYPFNSITKKIPSSLVLQAIFSSLNLQTSITWGENLYIDLNGKPLSKAYVYLQKEKIDMVLNFRHLTILKNYKFFDHTYPFTVRSLIILTKKADSLTLYEKICQLLSKKIIIVSLIVCSLTIFIFIIYEKCDLAKASLEVFRLILNTRILYMSDKSVMRIYLFPILILVFIINETFIKELMIHLTHIEPPIDYIDNLSELEYSNYDVYAAQAFQNYVLLNFTNKLHSHWSDIGTCLDIVTKKSRVACIDRLDHIKGIQNKAHVSKETAADFYECFIIRKNWPIKKKIDLILSRLMESGVISQLRYKHVQVPYKDMNNGPKYRKLTLREDLLFAFKFLICGLVLSAVCFAIEMRIKYVI